ncbi:MAG: YgiQ family radical SAM protein [Candidatus Omnitrophota bacterium]
MNKGFLPASAEEMERRGWKEPDIVLITGDAYVDHPSYGTALIGRVLEYAGFRVGIIAQPDCSRTDDFKRLGRPKLFFGVTAGNLDSMVANYTANRKIRTGDDYSPGGRAGLRPDRATIVYTNKIKEAFPGAVVVIGGMEASMRRLAHYDYWSDTVRRSVLFDAKADILVYGMGERQITEIARRLRQGDPIKALDDIRGTVTARGDLSGIDGYIEIPSFDSVKSDKDAFNKALKTVYSQADPFRGRTIVQRHGDRFAVHHPPELPLKTGEMDKLYSLPYLRKPHTIYDGIGAIPGFEMVRFSVTSHRGCPGGCNFCSLYLHQGRIVQSRSERSIVEEISEISRDKDFRGTVTDIGGPTANLYRARCERWTDRGACEGKHCLTPAKCKDLTLGYPEMMKLWRSVKDIGRVKHVFTGSGVRYDLLTDKGSDGYFNALCKEHISGQLKVAPEHSEEAVLKLMNKPSFKVYENFLNKFGAMNGRLRKRQYLVNYLISAHPGARLEDALRLSLELIKLDIHPEQIQDFIPLPMTVSGGMYYTERDPFTGRPVYVAKGERERKLQRALLQYKQPRNRRYVLEALRKLGRMDLKTVFLH